MNGNISRRDLLRMGGVSAAGLMLFGLSACRNGAEEVVAANGGESVAGEGARLRFSWWGPDDRAALYEEAVELFESRHDGVEILTEFADFGAFQDRLTTQAAAGDAPDVFWIPTFQVATFARRGRLLDLESFDSDVLDLSAFDDATLNDGRIDGDLVQLVHGYQDPAVFANDRVLDELGVTLPDSSNWRWEDVSAIAQEITDATDDGFWGSDDASSAEQQFIHWVRSAGGEFFDDDGAIGFDREVMVEWFRYWDDMRRSGACVPADIQYEDRPFFEGAPMIRGRAALHWRNSNHLPILQDLIEDEISIHLMPSHADAAPDHRFLQPNSVAINAETPHPEMAARLVNVFLNDPEIIDIVKLTIGAPPNPALRDRLKPDLSDPEVRFLEHIEAAMSFDRRPRPPQPPGASDVIGNLVRTAEEIAFDRETIDEGVDRFLAEAEAELERQAT